MILLLSFPGDPIVEMVARRLSARGARFIHYDDAQFPDQSRISVRYSNAGLTYRLRADGKAVDLSEIHAAWDHRPGAPKPSAALDPMSRRLAAVESQQFVDDVWRSLDCRWLPAHKDAVLRWQHKASQLQLAQDLGFEIPRTLMTNDPAAFREFYREQGGRIISKVFHRNIHRSEDSADATFVCMTQIVSNRDLGYASSIRYAPLIFQSYVPKDLELRVTVVGGRVLTAAIHSQGNHRTRHDWRHEDLRHTRYTRFTLPAEIESLCLRLVERMGLRFGTIDLVLTPDGRYVFLEINPSGQWRWVEIMTGLPISDSLAQWLMENDVPGDAP